MAGTGFFRGVRRVLWIATTPLALTFLLSTPARAQHGEDAPEPAASLAAPEGEAEEYESLEDHPPPHNPVLNFAGVHYGKDSEGGKYEPEKGDHKMPAPFGAALINFAILLFLVGRFAVLELRLAGFSRAGRSSPGGSLSRR